MMKTIAILLVFGSFLAGSFLAVLDPREINWSWLAPVLLIGAVGLWLSRKAHHEEAHAGSKLAGNIFGFSGFGQGFRQVFRQGETQSIRNYKAALYGFRRTLSARRPCPSAARKSCAVPTHAASTAPRTMPRSRATASLTAAPPIAIHPLPRMG